MDQFARIGVSKPEFTEEERASLQYSLIVESEKRITVLDYYDLFYYMTANSALNQMGFTKMSESEYLEAIQMFNQYMSSADYAEQAATYLSYLLYDTSRYFRGEAMLVTAIEYVLADVIPAQYYLTGHGETALEGTLIEEMLDLYGDGYLPLDLTNVDAIPEDASSVLVLAPTSDYTEGEVRMMKNYLERGGSMVFVTNEANLSMPNLMSLMAAYGMSALPGAVGEEVAVPEEELGETEASTDSEATTDTEGAEDTAETGASDETGEGADAGTENGLDAMPTKLTYTVDVVVNTDHDSLADLAMETSLAPAVTNGNSILFSGSDDPSLICTALFSTSKDAFIGEATEERGTRILAAAAENANGAHLTWFTGAESFTIRSDSMTNDNLGQLYCDFCLYAVMGWTGLTYESALTMPDDMLYDTAYLNVDQTYFGMITPLGVAITLTVGCFLVCCFLGWFVWFKRKKA